MSAPYRIVKLVPGEADRAGELEVLGEPIETLVQVKEAYFEHAKDDSLRPWLVVQEVGSPDDLHGAEWYKSDYNEILAYVEAAEAGRAWARGLKAGEPFYGCAPAARERHPKEEKLQRMFRDGAMDVLDKRDVLVDARSGLLVDEPGAGIGRVVGVGLIELR